MMNSFTRREFLRIAGGVTFFALVPNGKGAYAAPAANTDLPLFIVPPYIQPGPASKLIPGQDTLVVAWQTEKAPADFKVEFGKDKSYGQTATIIQAERSIGKAPKSPVLNQGDKDNEIVERRVNYNALMPGLDLGSTYYYRVSGNSQTIAEGYATTRTERGKKIRFVTFGDNSFGDISDRQIAYHAYQAKPDFVMNTGDNVYESGLDDEYARYFFPAYNADVAAPHLGAPLLRSVPFYTVMANHDVSAKGEDGGACANFGASRDSLGIYTAMYMPMNGPDAPTYPTPIIGPDDAIGEFKACAGERFPKMANYSFDVGDAHFCCLDSNQYVDPTDTALQAWIEQDLSGTDALWKFVVYHHPSFNVGGEHYAEQQFRVLAPIFEKNGVDMALHGHEHTYQRTMPIKFAPGDMSLAKDVTSKDRRVLGTFTVDTTFDGVKNTKPDGVIYLTTGAGGKELYEPDYTDSPDRWLHSDDNNIAYVSKFYSRHHSLTVIDIDGHELKLTQVNEFGDMVDQITIKKA